MSPTASPKLLCITSDKRFTQLVDRTLVTRRGGEVCHVESPASIQQLASQSFDAVLLDADATVDSRALSQIREVCGETPLMIASQGKPLEDKASLPKNSAISVVAKADLDEHRLAYEVLQLLASREANLQRALRGNLERLLQPPAEPGPATPLPAKPAPPVEKRSTSSPKAPKAPAKVVRLQGAQIKARMMLVHEGLPIARQTALVAAAGHDQLRIRPHQPIQNTESLIVVGVEQHGAERFEYYRPLIGAKGEAQVLERVGIEQLFPRADCCPQMRGNRLTLGLPAAMVEAWTHAGVLRAVPVDRVLVCPRCRAVPVLRPGCRACGSPWVDSSKMIHHFACAFVGPEMEFQAEDDLRCPKCLTRGLVIGVDCEHMPGASQCRECCWNDTQREMFGRCLDCAHVFPAYSGAEEEVIRYDVDRLDPLGFFTQP